MCYVLGLFLDGLDWRLAKLLFFGVFLDWSLLELGDMVFYLLCDTDLAVDLDQSVNLLILSDRRALERPRDSLD